MRCGRRRQCVGVNSAWPLSTSTTIALARERIKMSSGTVRNRAGPGDSTENEKRGCMVELWSLGGLSLWQLLRRTARETWQDSVFGQGGRMAFYQF